MARAEEARDVVRPRREAPDRLIGRVLRPRVMMPDWSAVTSGTARHALEAAFAVADRHEKWAGLGDEEDRVWRAVLQGFAAMARAPNTDGIAAAAGLPPSAVETALKRLRARDLVVLDERTGAVAAAYPFSEWPTGHRVRWDGMAAEALCAIDALGMGAMLGRDTVVETACRHCGIPIRVATRRQGTELAAVAPEGTVVWAGMAYAGNCGATSGCALKVFFCREEHLDAWREAGGASAPGFRLSVDEAHQVGRAMFGPMLRRPGVPAGRTA